MKIILKVYKITKNILPRLSNKLKFHVEKVSLENMNIIYNKVTKL